MFLKYSKYKQYVINNIDILNNVFKVQYNFPIKIIINGNDVFLEKKGISDNNVYVYEEHEDSIKIIDNYLKFYINYFLFSEEREKYLLDTIKRIGDIKKSEIIVKEMIIKGYLN